MSPNEEGFFVKQHRPTHDEYFLKMLSLVAGRSTCARRAVGAIIVTSDHRVLSTGYNGVPKNFHHCTEIPCPGVDDERGNTSRCQAVHAEVNAILQCRDIDKAYTIYVSCTPCFQCAKMICNTNIQRVVVLEEYADKEGLAMLAAAHIYVQVMKV